MSENVVDDRVRCLDTAKGFVTRDRNSSYGSPEDNFANIAAIWSAQGVTINGRGVTAADVALMMIGMKLARLKHNPTHEDSWIDAAGYAACGMRAANANRLNADDPTMVALRQQNAAINAVLSDPVEAKRLGLMGACGKTEVHEPHPFGEFMDEDCHGVGHQVMDASEVVAIFKQSPVSHAHEGDEATVEALNERQLAWENDSANDPGWVGKDRCQLRSDHPAHSYNDNAYWCDGYVGNQDRRQVVKDVEAVKRVADKQEGRKLIGPAHAHLDAPCTDACYEQPQERHIPD